MKYQIKFLSDWHVGSGLGAGAETDAEILKDENNLPYIPGKTIKGLMKAALFEMIAVNQVNKDSVDQLFGYEVKDDKGKVLKSCKGSLFFSNASLPDAEQKEITHDLAHFLYKNITQTKIDSKGVADSTSLRTMEVCMPIILEGEIRKFKDGIDSELSNKENALIENALKWVRRLGVNRNRGLGRCQFVSLENSQK